MGSYAMKTTFATHVPSEGRHSAFPTRRQARRAGHGADNHCAILPDPSARPQAHLAVRQGTQNAFPPTARLEAAAKLLRQALWVAVLVTGFGAIGQEGDVNADATPTADEEVIVIGRLYNAARQLMNERRDDEVVSDVLGDDAISRLGDTTVAVALRRISGLSLVNEKFIYVRGLGERYSSTSLNGATIPSPDLTRNVIPLDIFPTAIVQSLRVQKSYSADMPAAFGGGAVDIRTKGIPAGFTYALEVGSGLNFENDGDVFGYQGGGEDRLGVDDGTRAMSADLAAGIDRFLANVDVQGILTGLRREGRADATVAEARRINRELALHLNRDISLTEETARPDLNVKGSIGNNLLIGDRSELGFFVGGAYKTEWRETERVSRNFNFPGERTDTELESTFTVDLTGNLNLGARFGEDHEVATTTLFLRNTDDETAVRDFFNENREVSDGIGFRDYRLQFEQREMLVNQITGTHRLGVETRELPLFALLDAMPLPEDTEVTWFYSDARASTEIPNQVNVDAQTVTDPATGEVLSSTVSVDATTADYRFTDLDDEALNYGWHVTVPILTARTFVEFAGGFEHSQKVRTYRQSQFGLGALSVRDPSILAGPIGNVFSDRNILDEGNNFVFDLAGTNNQSYIAANMTRAAYGTVDWTLDDTWRVSAGARWEDYKQVALDWNIYGYSVSDPVVTTDPGRLQETTFRDDRIYPSLSLTYMNETWVTELFQLRFGWSETVVRPDLREITDASYLDPITDDLVDGNPGVVPADVSNFDLRAEWYFAGSDTVTVSFFRKTIDSPIEFFESAASDTTVAREIVNAESAEVTGIELEGLKELGFLGELGEAFFVQGNLTIQDSELVAGDQADAPTNDVRPLAGASEYVANLMLGFDSPDGRSAATIAYNVFGKRLYVAGRLGAPDGYEQPFHALDLTYSWFPTEFLTVKAKLRNILNQSIEIEREGVTVFREKLGAAASITVKWEY
ncbi:MAG: TonB-dependent receptor plug domain-containing protein [Gammaproteobacteria bacterium]|nr:TonB-dependent receptor plug domain-containing protein [Gammaproteobacteria bacterium]